MSRLKKVFRRSQLGYSLWRVFAIRGCRLFEPVLEDLTLDDLEAFFTKPEGGLMSK